MLDNIRNDDQKKRKTNNKFCSNKIDESKHILCKINANWFSWIIDIRKSLFAAYKAFCTRAYICPILKNWTMNCFNDVKHSNEKSQKKNAVLNISDSVFVWIKSFIQILYSERKRKGKKIQAASEFSLYTCIVCTLYTVHYNWVYWIVAFCWSKKDSADSLGCIDIDCLLYAKPSTFYRVRTCSVLQLTNHRKKKEPGQYWFSIQWIHHFQLATTQKDFTNRNFTHFSNDCCSLFTNLPIQMQVLQTVPVVLRKHQYSSIFQQKLS